MPYAIRIHVHTWVTIIPITKATGNLSLLCLCRKGNRKLILCNSIFPICSWVTSLVYIYFSRCNSWEPSVVVWPMFSIQSIKKLLCCVIECAYRTKNFYGNKHFQHHWKEETMNHLLSTQPTTQVVEIITVTRRFVVSRKRTHVEKKLAWISATGTSEKVANISSMATLLREE